MHIVFFVKYMNCLVVSYENENSNCSFELLCLSCFVMFCMLF